MCTYIKETVNKHSDHRLIDAIGRQQRMQCPETTSIVKNITLHQQQHLQMTQYYNYI